MKHGLLHRAVARAGTVFALGILCAAFPSAAQSGPQLLPYLINPVAGGGPVCSGAADTVGDGCTALNITLNTSLLGIAIDGQNNLYIEDTNNDLLRRVDGRTGLVTVAAGSLASETVCTGALDKYGDGCTATDGLANAAGGHTFLGKPYAIAIARNGDIFITGGTSLVQKISVATGMMTVVAGSTTPAGKTGAAVSGYTGDTGPATTATLNLPRGVAVDVYEDVFIADFTNNVIRVVYNGGAAVAAQITAANPSITSPVIGDIYTIAGSQTGVAGTAVSGVPAATALFTSPADVAVDSYGNVFIEDDNKYIRMIYAGGGNIFGLTAPIVGDIYTVDGSGSTKGNTLNWIAGTSSTMSVVRRILLDRRGNIYVTDQNQIVWFLDRTTGYTRPIVGVYKGSTLPVGCAQQTDSIGDNCPATLATLTIPTGDDGYGVAVDANNDLYVSDVSAETIRKVSSDIAFPATAPASPTAQTVELHYPAGSAPAATNPLVFANSDYSVATPTCTADADTTEDCTFAVTFTPSVPGSDPATLTATDKLGNVVTIGFTGTGTMPALAIDPGTASALGSGFNQPQGIAKDGNGNLYIADTANNRVVRYSILNQAQTVIAGTGTAAYTGDGSAATAATLSGPKAVAVAADGTIYIADTGNNAVRQINAVTGIISTFAGGAATVCSLATNTFGDGCLGTQATFSSPSGLAIDANGLLYVADTGNNRIRTVPTNTFGVLTVVGGGTVCSSASDAVGDGCNVLQATLAGPTKLRFDIPGNLYIADTGNNRVRRANLTVVGQTIVSVAGNGQAGGSGDGGAATSAQLNAPAGIALDGGGSLYITDTKNHAVRMVEEASGVISTIAGINGASGSGTLPAAATTIDLDLPQGVELTGTGMLYVLDSGNSRALAINRDSVQFNFGKVNLTQSSPAQPFLITSTGTSAAALGSPLTTATGTTAEFTFVPSTTNACSASEALAAGQQCSMTGQFTPAANGNVSATYTFAGGKDVNSPTPNVTLLGGGAQLVSTTSATVVSTPSSGNPQYGQSAAVTVTVTPASQGTATISGSVTVQVDGIKQPPVTVTANAAGNGIATVALPALNVGMHTITATYSGDAVYASDTAPALVITVVTSSTTTAVSVAPTAIIQFQSVTFTATVTSLSTQTPTGTVSFFNGTSLLGTGTLNFKGVATFTSATLPVGTYQIIAQYGGDGNFAASTSTPALTFVVSPDPPDFTLTPASSSVLIAQGGSVQAMLTITPSNTLNGNVTLSCSGLPVNSYCTFQPQVQSFTPATDQPVSVLVTLWTNIAPGTIPQTNVRLAGQRGWFALLAPFALLLVFRRKRVVRLAGLMCVLLAVSVAMGGCSSHALATAVTPGGTSTVSVQGTGPNGQSHTVSVAFTVTTNQ
jgi:sugar lactone lactonase YvrE